VDKVDSFLFIGSGTFHPVGLLLSGKKQVIAADPYAKKIIKKELLDIKDRILRQRYGAIASAKTSHQFGVLVGVKQGQQRIRLAEEIHTLLRRHGKQSYLIALDMFTPSSLEGFRDIDCFVSTACPRVALDDYQLYHRPILTPIEVEITLGVKPWEEYQFEQILPEN
jgi:2-(3-amino-3-carboxypropyl)histidine synthase